MKVNQHEDSSYGNLVAAIARLFLHKPYKTGTLEQPGRERLMVNLWLLTAPLLWKRFWLLPVVLTKGRFQVMHSENSSNQSVTVRE